MQRLLHERHLIPMITFFFMFFIIIFVIEDDSESAAILLFMSCTEEHYCISISLFFPLSAIHRVVHFTLLLTY